MAAIEKKIDKWGMYFLDKERDMPYCQILGGCAFPSGHQPGYAVILGAHRWDDTQFNTRHVDALMEFELAPMQSQWDLLTWICEIGHKEYCAATFYADMGKASSLSTWDTIADFNRLRAEHLQQQAVVSDAWIQDTRYFTTAMQDIKTRLSRSMNTFHVLNCNILAGRMRSLPQINLQGREEDYPHLYALALCFKKLSLFETGEAERRGGKLQRQAESWDPFNLPEERQHKPGANYIGSRGLQTHAVTED